MAHDPTNWGSVPEYAEGDGPLARPADWDEAYERHMETLERHEACKLGRCSIGRAGECPEIWEIKCYECAGFRGEGHFVMRRVVALGGLAFRDFDPTQTYKLECGHTTI